MFDQDNPQANRQLRRSILYWKSAPMSKLRQPIEDWEKDTRLYEARTENALNEDLKMTSLQSMRPERLVGHLELQSARLDTFDNFNTEILRLLEGTTPTEVDMMDALTKGKGKGKERSTKKGIRRRMPNLQQVLTQGKRLVVESTRWVIERRQWSQQFHRKGQT